MAQKPETKFRAWLRPRLEAIRNSWWESIQQKTIVGTPDIIGCIDGQFIALELKAEDGEPTALQKLKLQRIAQAGGIGLVVYPNNVDATLELLNNLGEEK